ncbi:MAG: cellulase family glycosylhydrolase [Acidobacteriota bacterium]
MAQSLRVGVPARLPAVVLAFVLACLVTGDAWAARARPTVGDGTIVADNGALLRGAHWSVDINGTIPSHSWVAGLKNRGFNALHVYGERRKKTCTPGQPVVLNTVGQYEQQIQDLVDMTDGLGLYLLLTVGDCDPGSLDEQDLDFAIDFWEWYAPRFKNDTHVLFEIRNEPYWVPGLDKSQPSTSRVRRLQRQGYNVIRREAPSTPVLLYSYAVFNNASGVLSDVNAVSSTVDWSNAAIAFHGYGGFSATSATLNSIRQQGIPVVQTEFTVKVGGVLSQDTAQTELYESTGTSWFTFLGAVNNSTFNQRIDQAGIVWAADYGTWPARHAPPTGQTISLRANSNSRYVSADYNLSTSPPLIANRTSSQQWEKLTVVHAGVRHVALRAQWIGKYVRVHPTTGRLAASQSSAGLREHFEWLTLPNGKVILKSRSANRLVSADHNQGWANPPLVANRTVAGVWETFDCVGCP